MHHASYVKKEDTEEIPAVMSSRRKMLNLGDSNCIVPNQRSTFPADIFANAGPRNRLVCFLSILFDLEQPR
jgi:hypothetical protein